MASARKVSVFTLGLHGLNHMRERERETITPAPVERKHAGAARIVCTSLSRGTAYRERGGGEGWQPTRDLRARFVLRSTANGTDL